MIVPVRARYGLAALACLVGLAVVICAVGHQA
jgi:hypothetical protein